MGRTISSPTRIERLVDFCIVFMSAVTLLGFWLSIQPGFVYHRYNCEVRILILLVSFLFFSSLLLVPRIARTDDLQGPLRALFQAVLDADLSANLLRFISVSSMIFLAVIFFSYYRYIPVDIVKPPDSTTPPINLTLTPTPTLISTLTPTPTQTPVSVLTLTKVPVIPTPTHTKLPTYTPTPISRPIVTVSPSSGPVGTKFLFNGSGFTPDTLIQRYIAGPNSKYRGLDPIWADIKGNFASILIPNEEWQAGTYTYVAQDTSGLSADISFVIVPTYVPPTSTPIPPTSTPTTWPIKRPTPTKTPKYTPTPTPYH